MSEAMREAVMRGIGPMLMVGVRGAEAGDAQLEKDLAACERLGVGGVILFDKDVASGGEAGGRGGWGGRGGRNVRSPGQVRELIVYLRERLGERLRVGVDQEGGAVARFREEAGFRASVSAGVFAQLSEAEQRDEAEAMARELTWCGVDVNFSPCVDLRINEGSGVIAGLGRSYGAEVDEVVACARIVIEAHERAGVRWCVKHFPGHGSVGEDSHEELADVTGCWARRELEPYRALVCQDGNGKGRGGVMTGHLLHREVDAQLPASLSRAWTQGVLRGELGFDGVVVTDSLDMLAVRKRWSFGRACVLAAEAGADVLLNAGNMGAFEDVEMMERSLGEAVEGAVLDGKGSVLMERIEESRVRRERYW